MFKKVKTIALAALTAAATLMGSGQVWAYTINGGSNVSSVNVAVGPFTAGCIDVSIQDPIDFGDGLAMDGLALIRFGNPASTNNQFGELTYDTSNTSTGATYYRNATDTAPLQACATAGTTVTGISWTAPNAAGIALTGTSGAMTMAVEYTDSSSAAFTCTIGWPGGLGTDLTSTCVAADSIAPSVTLSSGPASLTSTDPFTVTATFSEDVTDFDDLANDVVVANGSVTGITGGPAIYTLTITPTGVGNVEITVPAAAAKDAANIDNTASNTLTVGNTIVADTQKLIAGFMLGRANNLASNQPGLSRFLQGDGCSAFSANANEANGAISGCVSNGNTWVDITSSWGNGNSYSLGTVGAHGFVNPNLLIGGMVQFDYAEDDNNKASGTGWMVGPYFAAKAAEQPLFFEGRLLYGQTDNKISPLGTFTDKFETERVLAQLRATGEYKLQQTTLMPLFDLTYTTDDQKAYTDSLGNRIPGQDVGLTQVTAGMDFKTPITVQTGNLDLIGGLSTIYSSTDGGKATFEGGRGRVNLGLNYATGAGATLRAGAFYDGIGSKYQSQGANLSFDMKF